MPGLSSTKSGWKAGGSRGELHQPPVLGLEGKGAAARGTRTPCILPSNTPCTESTAGLRQLSARQDDRGIQIRDGGCREGILLKFRGKV